MKRSKRLTVLAAGAIASLSGLLIADTGIAHSAPCPWSLTPTCVTVTQVAPAAGATLQGTVALESTARQNEPARGNITHVEWWLYHPSFKTQNPNNEEGKVLMDERVNQPPSSGTLTNGTWKGSWTVPASRSVTARDGDYNHPGLRTYTLPTTGQYAVETHVLDAEWDRTWGGPPGRSGEKNVTLSFDGSTSLPTPTTAPTSSTDVSIGNATHRLSGTNIYRSTNFLVRYAGTPRSPANQWGFEVSVDSTGKILARSSGQPGMAIPAGGSVLSGHGAAATWLQTNGAIGATVIWPGSSTTAPPPTTTTSPPGNATSVTMGGATRALNGTNIPRAAGFLVRYTGTAKSPANQWGIEVAVGPDNKITAISRYQLGMTIPNGGSVVSGHDASATWLNDHAQVGATVTFNGGSGTTSPTTTTTPTATATAPADTGLALTGRWTVNSVNMPLKAMHATTLRDGRVLLLAGSGNSPTDFAAKTFKVAVWNPSTNAFLNLTAPEDMFCSGHATLPDGRVLIQGGTISYAGVPAGEAFRGSKSSHIFDPATNSFSRTNDTIEGHWYPTLTKIENGDIWAAGGYTDKVGGGPALSTELFSNGAWKSENDVPQTNRNWGTYPHMFLMADGRMFYTGGHTFGNQQPGTGALIYDWRTRQIGDIPGLRNKGLRDQAGSVLLPPAQNQTFMIAGGGSTDFGGSTNTVDLVNLNSANPTYIPGPGLPNAAGRMYLNLTTLPNRTVLASNGSTSVRSGDVKAASIYNPATNSWTVVDADPVGRNYHSAAVVLADGRVAVFGSNPADGSYDLQISIYEPPYLFKGTRPTITSGPTDLSYGANVDLGITGEVASASLLSPTSSTHQTDTNARLVDLPMQASGTNTRSVTIPTNTALLPPGPYLLTVMDTAGVPSIAKWVNVR